MYQSVMKMVSGAPQLCPAKVIQAMNEPPEMVSFRFLGLVLGKIMSLLKVFFV